MAVPRIPLSCATCGAPMLVRTKAIATGRGKYCGMACRNVGLCTHGETRDDMESPEYTAWASIKKRCLTPTDSHYQDYGARGITVCDAWRDSFDAFLSDVGRRPSPKHSIDRWPNNMGNYEPGNVRWATHLEQQTNKPNNRLLTFNGTTRCVSEWSRETGINVEVLYQRLTAGWGTERALTTQVKVYVKRCV